MSIRLTLVLTATSCLFFLMIDGGCKHSTDPISQTDTTSTAPPPDTNWVTKPQVDIPWPGLANSPWPMINHDPQHTGRSAHRGPQEGQVEWLFDEGNSVYSSPAIDFDGTIYSGCDSRNFFATLPNGVEKWRNWGGSDSSPLIAEDGSIYMLGRGPSQIYSYLYCYDRNGNVKWQFVVETWEPLSAPSISKDGKTIYLATGYLYAIQSDGTLAWRLKPDTTDNVHYSLAMSPDGMTLYVPGQKALYAVDTSGFLKWKVAQPQPVSNPSVDNDGNVYFGGGTGVDALYSVSKDGKIRWTAKDIYWGSECPGPVIGRDGTIYIAGSALYAVDYAGKLKWKYQMPTVRSQCVPAIDVDGAIYFGRATSRTVDDSLNFFALNSNGTLKYAISLRSPDGSVPDIDSNPAISSDGKIYVGSDRPHGFHLYKIK